MIVFGTLQLDLIFILFWYSPNSNCLTLNIITGDKNLKIYVLHAWQTVKYLHMKVI